MHKCFPQVCNKPIELQFMSNQMKLELDDNRLSRKQDHMVDPNIMGRIQLKCVSLFVQNILPTAPVTLIVLVSVITFDGMIAVI